MRKLLSTIWVMVLATAALYAQNSRTVTGKVTDEKSNPIAGAAILVKGTAIGATTKEDGTFSLSIPSSAKTLVVSSVNYLTQELAIQKSNIFSVVMKLNAESLQEVVVTALGIKRQDKSLGYGVAKIDPSTVLQRSEPDVLKSLAGKVPGVDIRSGQGAPGAATRIQIRGVNSFQNPDVLIVVDGVPYSNNVVSTSNVFSGGGAYGSGIANLDPNDIESANVLKGAAATALYGSRGASGVLLITTKSGAPKKGQKSLNITYRGGYSMENIANIPQFQNDYGAGANWRVQASNGSWGGKFGRGVIYDATGNIIGSSASGIDSIPATTWATMFASYPELFPNGRLAYKAVPNNVAALFNTGQLFEHSVGLNGGEGSTLFNLTLSNVNQTGYITNTTYKKHNISVGGQTSFGKLTVGATASFAKSRQIGGFIGQAQSFLSQWGRTYTMARNWDIVGWPSENRAGQQIGFNDNQYTNPVWGAWHNVITTDEERTVVTARASYVFSKAFRINYNAGINKVALYRDQIIDKSSYGSADNLLGTLTEVVSQNQELNSTLVAIYTPKIGKDFTLDVKVGNDINQRTSRLQQVQGVNFVIPGLFNLRNTAIQRFSADQVSKRRLAALFADVSIGYKDYAFLNATLRRDQTSTLPYKNATYYYPAVSGSLIWTDALKLKSKVLDYGKIRVGYASVGNDASPQNGEATFGLNSAGFLGQALASRDATTYDINLTPEFTKEFEIGTELRLFKRRVGIDLTYYKKITTNLIYGISLPSTTGFTSYFTNIGEISNEGVEAAIDLKPFAGKNFQWDIRTVYTKNINMVNRLYPGITRAIIGGFNYIEAGMPYGYLRGSYSARTDDGKLLINQSSGMPMLDPNEGMVGNPNPDFKMGITNTFTYKNFQFNFLFDWTQGGSFYSETINGMLGRGVTLDTWDREKSRIIEGVYANTSPVTGPDGLNRFTPLLVGGKTVPNQTRVTTNDLFFTQGTGASFATNGAFEYSVFDGTIYRFRELVVSYSFPMGVVKKLKANAITFSISARNLWYLAPNVPKYTRFDPDINNSISANAQGVETGGAPSSKRFGINLNVTF